MGYPMTWKRIVNRNGLRDGTYNQPPQIWRKTSVPNDDQGTLEPGEKTALSRFPFVCQDVIRYESKAKLLAGDIRRLENDVQDEGLICKEIARRTGLEEDVVAAVLKEFMEV